MRRRFSFELISSLAVITREGPSDPGRNREECPSSVESRPPLGDGTRAASNSLEVLWRPSYSK
jgi:hypothetical protein